MKRLAGVPPVLLFLAVLMPSVAWAQTAEVQVIHNAADPAAAVVDLYLGEELLLDDFAFRTATSYVALPAEDELLLGVAPGDSEGPDDILAAFAVTLAAGERYVAVASGVLDPTLFAPNPDGFAIDLDLFLRPEARDEASTVNNLDFFIGHGVTDAPAVDVAAREVGPLVEDLAYGDFSAYLGVPPAVYGLDVTLSADPLVVVGSFEADVTGLAGRSAVVLASGFVDPSANEGGAGFALIGVLADGTVFELPRVVDEEPGCTYSKGFWKNHPEAWPFDIAPHDPFYDSGKSWLAVLKTPPAGGNAYYILAHQYIAAVLNVANGADDEAVADVLAEAEELLSTSASAYPGHPERKRFTDLAEILDAYNNGHIGPGHCDAKPKRARAWVQVIHNAADPAAAVVDLYLGEELLLDDFAFRTATSYVALPAEEELLLGVAPGDSEGPADILAAFAVTLAAGERYVAVASGVLDPTLFAPNPDGFAIDLDLLVHPGPRPPHTYTASIKVPPGHYPPPGQCRLWYPGRPPGHQPSPVPCEALEDVVLDDVVIVTSSGQVIRQDPDEVTLLVGHGVTDAPAVDVTAREVGPLVEDLAYGDFSAYLGVPPAVYGLDVTLSADPLVVVGSFEADVTGLAGRSAVVLASGFVDPSANEGGAGFALIGVLADGTVFDLPTLDEETAGVNSRTSVGVEYTGETPEAFYLDGAYPNPFNPATRIRFGVPEAGEVRLAVYDAVGRHVTTLVDQRFGAGAYSIRFQAGDLPSGVYFYQIVTPFGTETRQMVLVK